MIARIKTALAWLLVLSVIGNVLLFRQSIEQRAALDAARAYIESTKDVTNAIGDVPTDPDDVLSELCRFAPRGTGCGDP